MNEVKNIKKIVNSIISNLPKDMTKNIKEDLYQEGYIGYLVAEKSYNLSLNVKKSTWIGNCVFYAIQTFLSQEFPGYRYKNLFTHIELEDIYADQTEYFEQVELENLYKNSLTSQQRKVIELHSKEELTFNEISKKLNLSLSYCHKEYQNSINKLKENLQND